MEMTYDKKADAAYIYFTPSKKKIVKKTVPMNENIILDFDSSNKLIGIEILSASKVVSKKAIAEMQT